MRTACCLGLLLLLVGCGKFNGDIIDPDRCNTVQGVLKYDELEAQGKIQKKVFCEIEKKGKMVVEQVDSSTQKVSEIEIKETELDDIKALFVDALKDQCPDCLALSEEEADVVVKASIVRFVGHVKSYETSGDESMVFLGGDREGKLEYQAALTVDTDIAGKESTYDHIVSLDVVHKTHVEKMYAVLAASTETDYITEFVTKYDSMPLATGAVFNSQKMNAYLGFNTWHYDHSGYIDVYGLSDLKVERHLDLSENGTVWWWDDDTDEQVIRAEVISLYSSGVGNMRYLVYDYIKNLLAAVQDAQ